MDVPPVKSPPSSDAAALREGPALPDLPFALGQHLFARVVQVLSPSEAILNLAGQRLRASLPLPVAAGEVLHVAVRALAPAINLELLEAPVEFSEQAYALAAVMQARQSLGGAGRLSATQMQDLLTALTQPDVRGVVPARDSARAQLADALRPVALAAESSAIVASLRQAVAVSATFVESKLAALVTAGRGELDPATLRENVRVLLARLTSETAGSPELERARLDLVADTLLRQLDVAAHKLKDGEARLDIPVSVNRTLTDVRMRVRDDPPRDRPEAGPDGRVIDLVLQLPRLGRVRASLRWTPGHVAARFAVEDAAAEHALAGGLDGLVSRLTATGFRHVTADVAVDPAALNEGPDDPEPSLPGGSILSARA